MKVIKKIGVYLNNFLDSFKDLYIKIFCIHEEIEHLKNIHGDKINILNDKRSVWKCKRCDSMIYLNVSFTPTDKGKISNLNVK